MPSRSHIDKYICQFNRKSILVVGDVMVDDYVWGNVNRISPEAPVQVVEVTSENSHPGGAGNVASNIASLGGTVYLAGVIGEDESAAKLIALLKQLNIGTDGIVSDPSRCTTRKTRVFSRNQQLLRFDREIVETISEVIEKKILAYVREILPKIDVVLISDYAKGVVTDSLIRSLKTLSKNHRKPLLVDPRPIHVDYYKGISLITPNHSEASLMANISHNNNSDDAIEKIGRTLVRRLNCSVLITRGEKGMSLFLKNKKTEYIPTFAKKIFDIVGAGDTALATLSLAIASGAPPKEATIIANLAAGITVGKLGTSTVTADELLQDIP